MTPHTGQVGKAAGPKKAMPNQQGMGSIQSDKSQHPAVLERKEQMSL